ncbi:MAG: TonB-dependent receptor [Sphingobacteriales bacterium]|nr:TonB-dependent receptor [Sphingobacteriales bacterium]
MRLPGIGSYLQSCTAKEAAKDSFYTLSPVEVRAIRAGENAPFTKTNLSKKEISGSSLGQDIPFLLNQVPSVVVNSDAGNAIGYTGIRIRGTDATRINMTLNGIPYNDAESQGLFFVNLPDFSSSAGSVQVQRGVGTSSNGAGAFGASMNFSTNEVNKEAYVELNNSAGSFHSWKNTLKYGSGLVNGFTTDIRLSRISSDGFIDRAKSDLRSFFISTARIGKNYSLRFNAFSGKEKTYQAWYGISESDLQAGNRTVNYAGTEKPGAPYSNETDNYTQTHYQLFFSLQPGKKTSFHAAGFLTRGKGYYEQYKADEDYARYNLAYPVNDHDTTYSSDFIRQLWLDNYFYGTVFSGQYKSDKTQATLGGGLTRYDGKHYGKLIWASNGLTGLDSWYHLTACKTDFNIYGKQQTELSPGFFVFYDLQYRYVKYTINGFRDNPGLRIPGSWHFFNPKAGITYKRNNWKTYFSYGAAHKEPNRDDFEAGREQQPKPERLHDIEAGVEQSNKRYSWGATVYYMLYKDQLVLTGKINDVGAYTRTNIPNSYRAGIELQGAVRAGSWLNASVNLTFSRNRVKDVEEYIDDYDNGGQKTNHYPSADIALSPAITGSSTLNFGPFSNTVISLISKYVSRQYLDNTSNETRSLDPFFVQDLRITHTIKNKWLKEMNIIGQLNNAFNTTYEPNGYTFSYIYGGQQTTENYYFPMAGINFMIGVNIRL